MNTCGQPACDKYDVALDIKCLQTCGDTARHSARALCKCAADRVAWMTKAVTVAAVVDDAALAMEDARDTTVATRDWSLVVEDGGVWNADASTAACCEEPPGLLSPSPPEAPSLCSAALSSTQVAMVMFFAKSTRDVLDKLREKESCCGMRLSAKEEAFVTAQEEAFVTVSATARPLRMKLDFSCRHLSPTADPAA
jgi:hypothetical protein